MGKTDGFVGLPVPGQPQQQLPTRALSSDATTPAGRPLRHPEEDRATADYVQRLRDLGPRPRESYVTFRRRIASVIEGRKVWLEAAATCGGNISECCRQLGVNRHNARIHLKQVGLKTADILAFQKVNSTTTDEVERAPA